MHSILLSARVIANVAFSLDGPDVRHSYPTFHSGIVTTLSDVLKNVFMMSLQKTLEINNNITLWTSCSLLYGSEVLINYQSRV